LQEESPSPLERKLQEVVLGSTGWMDVTASNRDSTDPLTSSIKMQKIGNNKEYSDVIEFIPLHQE
jgi:hypothetical protein